MVDLIITGVAAALMIAICCAYLKYEAIKEKKSLIGILPKGIKQTLFGTGIILSTILIFTVLFFLYGSSWIFAVKRIVLFTALWPIAFIDYRKHIIPNKLLCFLLIVRLAVAIAEMICDFKSAKGELLSCLIAGAGIAILLCIMRLIVKEGIGFGDIKLFAVMGLFLGVRGSIPSIFMSFVVSFFVSIYMLISKRKSRKDQIAFAPSILVGTMLSIIFLGA